MAVSPDKTRITVSIKKELDKKIEEIAKSEDLNKSQIVSILLKEAIVNREIK